MKAIRTTVALAALLLAAPLAHARQWTLQQCIDYALQNNITLQQTGITRQSAHEDLLQSKAALLPSLSASTSQNVGYTPFQESGRAAVTNGYVENSVDKVYYNGSYGINLNWTVWNGGRNRKQVKLYELNEQQAELDSATQANSIQEQIVQLYVQILYSKEAIEVNKASLATAQKNEERAKTMLHVGSISKSDLAELTAQRANDEYNVVAAEQTLRNYKRQLKQLLELTDDEEFDVVASGASGDALQDIPALQGVYNNALDHRPEIAGQRLVIEQSDMSIDIAKAQRLPTVSFNAGVSTNTTSLSDNAWGTQLKSNLGVSGGFTVSVPILDNRESKTAINKAQLQRQSAMLELKNQQVQLYSTIENYWIQAVTNQSKYRAAKVNTESQETSYEMLSEQFQQGLKNIVELMQGKNNLLTAQQNELESKYLTLLNIEMLKFYQDGTLNK